MSLSLLNQNTCTFHNCGLHFQNLYDLIAHVEFAHIPLVEEENRRKGAVTSLPAEDNRITVAANMPLSCFQRVFPTPYRPTPCSFQTVKVSFNHYRRRPMPAVTSVNIMPSHANGVFVKDEVCNPSVEKEEPDECAPNDPEMRYRCEWIDCGKRFKNNNALRQHMRSAHNTNSTRQDDTVHHQNASSLESSTVSSPTKYAQSRPHKCNQCSKRYKTTQGLQNHISQAHQKLNGGVASDSNAPSPAALAQLIIQGHSQQSIDRQNYPLRPTLTLPPQNAAQDRSSNSSHQGLLPLRSFPVHPNRIQNHPLQTTGQMLKQQMSRQLPQQSAHISNLSHSSPSHNYQQNANHIMHHHPEQTQMQSEASSPHVDLVEMDMRTRYPATMHQINNSVDLPIQNQPFDEKSNN